YLSIPRPSGLQRQLQRRVQLFRGVVEVRRETDAAAAVGADDAVVHQLPVDLPAVAAGNAEGDDAGVAARFAGAQQFQARLSTYRLDQVTGIGEHPLLQLRRSDFLE